jgi:hypothetical protein
LSRLILAADGASSGLKPRSSKLSKSCRGAGHVSALASLYQLNWLVMQSNHIQNVSPLASLTNLYYQLDLSANEISDISPITNLHSLTWLGAWQNKLTQLPSLIGLSNVTSLDFWGNQLTNVSGVSGMTQLNWLGLSRNNLTTIQPLSNLPNLNTIDLYTNFLTDISGIGSLTNLTWVNANENNLQDIHSLRNLTHLYYAGLLYNLLDTNIASVAMANIAVMQGNGTYVDYIPQKIGSSAAPLLTSDAWLGGNQFRFTIQGLPSTVLQIYTSTNLTTWTTGSFVTNITGSVNYTDAPPVGPKRFYRALKL